MLCIWLPLNRDLHNQGLLGNSVFSSNGNITVNNNGKIGKCYSFDGRNSYLIADFKPGEIVPNEMSFCCWVKLNEIDDGEEPHAQTLFCSRQVTGAGLFIFITSSNQLRFDNGNNSNVSNNHTTFNYIFQANIWYHIAVIQTNTQKKLYINGILQQSINKASANSGSNSATKCTIGGSGSNNATGNWLNGYLNDVRVYNHALSDKEVEEIAKGLVLHYKLDGENIKNLLTNSSSKTAIVTDTTNNVYTGYWYLNSSYQDFIIKGITLTVEYDYNIDLNTITTTNSNLNLYSQFNTSIISPAQRLYYEDIVTNPIGHKRDTFIITQAQADYASSFRFRIRLQNANEGATFTISNIKMYFGTYNNIIHDSSGYGNNGTITGSLETTTPSPRYNCATHFPVTSSKIHISDFLTSGFGNSYSFAWWGKRDANNSMFWGFSNGIRLNGMYSGNFWNTGDGNDNPLYKIGTIAQVSAPSVEVWHHYVMTGNSTKCYVYLDGELWAEAKNYKAISGTSIYINGWNSGTSYSSSNTDMSDFRIYATALTAGQVADLYRTSMTIDNQGNIHARELVE